MNAFLRTALVALLAPPTSEFRRRAWRTFEQALDRDFVRKRRLRPVETQR
ncbi:MAG: hypothetical protein M3304_02810 [Actinomycetota bacterium]|nr:hypothetical protein [Actinomycetota bacterium]